MITEMNSPHPVESCKDAGVCSAGQEKRRNRLCPAEFL